MGTLYVLLQAAANQVSKTFYSSVFDMPSHEYCFYLIEKTNRVNSSIKEGGLAKQTERCARLVKYDITVPSAPRYARGFIAPLPFYVDPTAKASKNPKVVAQSEIFHIQDGLFFVMARDSGAGHRQTSSLSVYRRIDVFDIASTTDIKGSTYDCSNCSIDSSDGVLKSGITPATYCSFIDFNVNSQLNRFDVHNGGAQEC
jgi:hypothetical protein